MLEGATDIGAALEKLIKPSFDIKSGTPINVFLLSDGQITWGNPQAGPMIARFESRCPYPTRLPLLPGRHRRRRIRNSSTPSRAMAAASSTVTGKTMSRARPRRAHRRLCLQIENVKVVGANPASDVVTAGRKAAVYPDSDADRGRSASINRARCNWFWKGPSSASSVRRNTAS